MTELTIKTLVDEINRMRYESIMFHKEVNKDDPQWFYIEGMINSLTNVLYFYYAKKGGK